jgi:glyoxylase-like metal-dependent hydrolase (beta-lactamase superfamily II)
MIEVRTQSVGPWPMNAYALVDSTTAASVLIDPGADPDALRALLAGTRPQAIWLTHTHMDHVGALAEMQAALKVPIVAYDGPWTADLEVPVATFVADGDSLTLGPATLRVHYAPGHIEDQVCYTVEGQLVAIVGDTIFAGGPGKTWSAEDFQTTLNTLRRVVLSWPDDTVCYPGHGDAFRLGDIRPQIEAFLARDFGDFYGDATWDMASGPGDIEITL